MKIEIKTLSIIMSYGVNCGVKFLDNTSMEEIGKNFYDYCRNQRYSHEEINALFKECIDESDEEIIINDPLKTVLNNFYTECNRLNKDGATGVYLGFPIFSGSINYNNATKKYGTKINIYDGLLSDNWSVWGSGEYRQINDYIELNYYNYASNSYRVYFRFTEAYRHLSTANTRSYLAANIGENYRQAYFCLTTDKKLLLNFNLTSSGDIFTTYHLFTLSEMNQINYPNTENYTKNAALTSIKTPSNLSELVGENVNIENINHSKNVNLPANYSPNGIIEIEAKKFSAPSNDCFYYYMNGGGN